MDDGSPMVKERHKLQLISTTTDKVKLVIDKEIITRDMSHDNFYHLCDSVKGNLRESNMAIVGKVTPVILF